MPPRETTRRVSFAAGLVALLFASAAALRGYVPGAVPAPREPPADHPLAMVIVVVLLVGAVSVVAIAVISRLRSRTPVAPRSAGRPDWFRGDRGRLTWRVAVVAFAVIVGWLLVAVLLGNLVDPVDTTGDGPAVATPPGATQTPGNPTPEPEGSGPRSPSDDVGSDLLGYFYGGTVVFVFVLVAGSIVAARRRHPLAPWVAAPDDDDAARGPDAGAETLFRAAEVGLAEVGDLSREPRTAIIACYAAMERQLSLLPDAAPRDFDTASEVLARAVEHRALAPDSATQLVDLFEEARFSPHVMDEGHRDAAVAVLTQVLDELRSHA